MGHIQVLYFAGVRELMGRDQDEVALSALGEQALVADLWAWLEAQAPGAAQWRGTLRIAVNQEFVSDAFALSPGDEVALIPPVSGGSGCWRDDSGFFVVTAEVLDVRAVEALVQREDAGALVTFQGTVRDHTGDRKVSHLEYEAYGAMALKKLKETALEARSQWPQVMSAIHHRHGKLGLGEVAVVIAVSSPHRKDAFLASQFIIDRLKEVVPIWKKEVSPDGSEWVGWGP